MAGIFWRSQATKTMPVFAMTALANPTSLPLAQESSIETPRACAIGVNVCLGRLLLEPAARSTREAKRCCGSARRWSFDSLSGGDNRVAAVLAAQTVRIGRRAGPLLQHWSCNHHGGRGCDRRAKRPACVPSLVWVWRVGAARALLFQRRHHLRRAVCRLAGDQGLGRCGELM